MSHQPYSRADRNRIARGHESRLVSREKLPARFGLWVRRGSARLNREWLRANGYDPNIDPYYSIRRGRVPLTPDDMRASFNGIDRSVAP